MFGVPHHFLIVHFPLVLIIGAVFCDLTGKHEGGYRFTFWAGVSGAMSILTGLLLSGGQLSQMPVHAGAAIGGSFLIVIVAVLRYSQVARGEQAAMLPKAWLLLELLAAGGVLVAAITGHRAVLGL
jgi:uncharacterized membrane protein